MDLKGRFLKPCFPWISIKKGCLLGKKEPLPNRVLNVLGAHMDAVTLIRRTHR